MRIIYFLAVVVATGLFVGTVGYLSPGSGPAAATTGNSITAPDTGGSVGDFTSVKLDAAGNPVIAYRDNSNMDLKIMHCNDPNCSGGDESITSPDTVDRVGNYISLELDATGNPVVSYRDNTNADLKVMHCNDPNCSGSDESITSPDAVDEVGGWTSLELGASGNPVVSYFDHSNSDLKVLRCDDADCDGGGESTTTPDSVGDVGRWTSLALDASDHPVVSYFDQTNFKLKVLHCINADCSGGGQSITSPDTAGGVGLYSSLVLDAAGNPVVSYFDDTNDDLKVLHCNDANCSGGDESITSPDAAGSVGDFTSLELDASGNPVVSYRDLANNDLKVLHCNDANCAGGDDSIVSLDTAGDGGAHTSLALDVSGNPIVSYFNTSSLDLRLLNCSDASCSGAKPTPTTTSTPTMTPTPTPSVTPTKQPDPFDTDRDGCSDQRENGPEARLGGQRDFLYFWDFYDVWTHPVGEPALWFRDRTINIFDILGVALRFGPGPSPPPKDQALLDALTPPVTANGYHIAYDRGAIIGPNNWNRAPADGTINIVDDILGVAFQFGHTCS